MRNAVRNLCVVFALIFALSLYPEVESRGIQGNADKFIAKRELKANDDSDLAEDPWNEEVQVKTTTNEPDLPNLIDDKDALEDMEQIKRKNSGKREDADAAILDSNIIKNKREDIISKAEDAETPMKETKKVSNSIAEDNAQGSDAQKKKRAQEITESEPEIIANNAQGSDAQKSKRAQETSGSEPEKISDNAQGSDAQKSKRDDPDPELEKISEKEDPVETNKVKDMSPDNHFSGKDDKGKPAPGNDIQIAKDYANLLNTKLYGQPISAHGNKSDEDAPILFTVTNTNVGRSWDQIPYREKFQWYTEYAPCFTYTITIPDERTGHGQIPICLYRKNLEFKEESSLIIHQEAKMVDPEGQRNVAGQVKGSPGSSITGRFVDKYFYGNISLHDPKSGHTTVYIVEEIKYLSRLLRHSHKLVSNLLMVMENETKKSNETSPKFNAVITKGVSILSFMGRQDPNNLTVVAPASFVILSTKQNSYITSGELNSRLDENGNLIFTTRENVVTILTDESVKMKTKSKEYTFRPQGKTMVSEGMNAEALRQLEGVVTVTAITDSMTYSCVLPSPSVTKSRQGGFLCKVCLAADLSFQEKYLQKLGIDENVTDFLGQTIDNVSWIFRSVDWNGDGKSDNVGLDYELTLIPWNYDGDSNETETEEVDEEGMEVLFKSLASVDFSNCCLGISYTMKKFPPDIFAKSFSSKPMIPGGACAIRNDGLSNNAILISANSKEGNFSAVSKDQLLYLTAREVAISFGATADTSGQDGCDSFVDKSGISRHYILWPDVMRDITPEEKTFSNCSKRSIFKALSSCKSSCFDVDRHPFCGNGVEEEGEECDCGNEYNCTLQLCCYGRTGKFPCRKTGAPCAGGASESLSSISSLTILMSVLSGISLQLISAQL